MGKVGRSTSLANATNGPVPGRGPRGGDDSRSGSRWSGSGYSGFPPRRNLLSLVRRRRDHQAGFTTIEFLVASTVGLLITGAALSLCHSANRITLRLMEAQERWHHLQAASTLWASEWRGAGFDPTGEAGTGVTRWSAETLEFTGDWNGSGSILPTSTNPNERLAYSANPGMWRRGVNGGGRLLMAWPDSVRFGYSIAGQTPTIAEASVVLHLDGPGDGLRVKWTAARRNSP